VDDAELTGGVLYDSADPYASARRLAELLLSPAADARAAREAGFEPDLVGVLRNQLGGDPGRVAVACDLGAAWVAGRRSAPVSDVWDLVASLPAGASLPPGLRRTTGETLMRVVVEATRTLRLVSPFIDRGGLDFLSDALASATGRGVRLDVLLPSRSTMRTTRSRACGAPSASTATPRCSVSPSRRRTPRGRTSRFSPPTRGWPISEARSVVSWANLDWRE